MFLHKDPSGTSSRLDADSQKQWKRQAILGLFEVRKPQSGYDGLALVPNEAGS